MKKARLLFLICIYSMFAMACSTEPEIPSGSNTNNEVSNENSNQEQNGENTNDDNSNNTEESMSNSTIKIEVNGTTLTATLKDNVSTRALVNLLKGGPLTINMNLILYLGQYFVIYYAPNTYSLTPLGKIDNTSGDELIRILGNCDVTVTISLSE